MPVSPYASEHEARQHSAMIARWNSTRERINSDERQRILSEMSELDGTGLHERADWPLPAAPSDDGREEIVDAGKHVPTEPVEAPAVDDNAVLRRSEEIAAWPAETFLDEPDVSDIEEEDEDGRENGHINGYHSDRKRDGADHIDGEHVLDQDRGHSTVATAFVRPQVDTQTRNNHGEPAELSPVREEESASSGRISPEATDGAEQEESTLQSDPVQEPEQQQDDMPEEELEESRDVATPIPFAGDSPSLRQGSTPSPQVNGNITPTTNGHVPRSSIAKSPLFMPHRRTPTASSMHSTTQIPANRDRVRYSWQSLQDDEPNRPRIHIIKLVSNVATASAGFPQGEAFGFSISPGGKRIAAYNSARLYVLQTAALPVGISQDYALRRRPLAVEITDEASTMAILADDHTINIYELGPQRLQRTRTITLDFSTNCIALAPTGGLVAAAYEGGIEIFSLSQNALPTDRRAVRSIRMDRMAFSGDGSTLLGTTTRINTSSTVVVSVPVFPSSADGIPTHEELKEAWCSELLHPENIRNSSHATFMRENRATCNDRLFAWNGLADTFGILNVGDMEYGNIDFPVVIAPPLSTCGGLGAAIHSCPAVDEHGDTVAMVVNDRTIRLYIVPHKIEDDETSVEAHSIDHELDEGYGCPFSEVRWVCNAGSGPAPLNNQTAVKGRLIVTSPGGVVEGGNAEELVEDIEGGRIIMFDFDPHFTGQPGQTFSLTLGKSPPQLLEEEQVNVAEQVALVRRRTVNQSKSGGMSQRPAQLGRAATTFGNHRSSRASGLGLSTLDAHRQRESVVSIGSMQSEASRSLPDLAEGGAQVGAALEEPYAQNAPRSQVSLQRAASNAQKHRFQALEERTQERVSVDSSGNFLPLPEYTEEPNAPLPSRYRAMAGLDQPAVFKPKRPVVETASSAAASSAAAASAGPTSATASATTPRNIGEATAEEAFRNANAALAAAADRTINDEPEESATLTNDSRASIAPSQHDTIDSTDRISQSDSLPPNNRISHIQHDTIDPISPVARTGTFDSLASMPRSLQRAYSNAMPHFGHGPGPAVTGDWRNGVTLPGHISSSSAGATTMMSSAFSGGPSSTAPSSIREEEIGDVISPIGRSDTLPFARQNTTPYRYSTSLLNPPGHMNNPYRASSSASSFQTTLSGASGAPSLPVGGRHIPPHMQAFRTAAANASASLFPPTLPPDHVPLREPHSRAGTVGHPITGWRPPAPSSAPPPSSARSHSRKSSLAGKSAFASTAKAKKLGFFKKGRNSRALDPYSPSRPGGEDGGSMIETKSVATWMTRGEGKCVMM